MALIAAAINCKALRATTAQTYLQGACSSHCMALIAATIICKAHAAATAWR